MNLRKRDSVVVFEATYLTFRGIEIDEVKRRNKIVYFCHEFRGMKVHKISSDKKTSFFNSKKLMKSILQIELGSKNEKSLNEFS